MTIGPRLEWCSVTAGYQGVPVIKDLNLVVQPGAIVALLGANGVGKTTTLHTAAGILQPMTGSVRINGDVVTSPIHHRARRGMALVTEERAVIQDLTVKENLQLGTKNPERALKEFPELERLLRRRVGLLSGGEQQMLVLARVLANSADIILVDELSFGLAPLVVSRLLESLRSAADEGASVVLVEQHPKLALSVADYGYVISGGAVRLEGSSTELLGKLDDIEATYLSVVSG